MSEDVFPRVSGYSNEEMVKRIEITQRVMNLTESVKAGRGRKVKVTKRLKYRGQRHDEVRARVERSIDFYKNLAE